MLSDFFNPSHSIPSLSHKIKTMADQFLGFDLSTQQLKGEPHHSYPTTLS